MGPRLTFQGRVDEDQVFPPSEADRPTYATIIDDFSQVEGTSNTGRRETDLAEVSRCRFRYICDVGSR